MLVNNNSFKMNNKIIRTIMFIGLIISFILSLLYTIKSFNSISFENNTFHINSSFMVSNLTTFIILFLTLRWYYIKNSEKSKILFSKHLILLILVYVTVPLDIILYNIFQFGFSKSAFISEKIINISFIMFSLIAIIKILKSKEINTNNVV